MIPPPDNVQLFTEVMITLLSAGTSFERILYTIFTLLCQLLKVPVRWRRSVGKELTVAFYLESAEVVGGVRSESIKKIKYIRNGYMR